MSILVLVLCNLHRAASEFFSKAELLHICFRFCICATLFLELKSFAMAGKADPNWPGCSHPGLLSLPRHTVLVPQRAFTHVFLLLEGSFPSISAWLVPAHHSGLCLRGAFSGTPSLNNFLKVASFPSSTLKHFSVLCGLRSTYTEIIVSIYLFTCFVSLIPHEIAVLENRHPVYFFHIYISCPKNGA